MRNLRSRFLEHGAGDVWQDIRHAQVQDKLAAAGQLAVPDIERQQGPHPHQNLQTGQGSAPGVGNNLNRRKHQKKVTFEWIYHTFHGAAGAGDVLVPGPAQHGVHGVPHLVEEVVQGAHGEQGGRGEGGRGQVQHQHHHRVLVAAVPLDAAAADGEVAVLQRLARAPEQVAVDVAEQLI